MLARRAAALLAGLAAATVVVPAAPAAADPARPGNVRSEVLAVTPPTPTVDVAVEGGDAFLRLTVEAGTVAEVPGYRGEPYLRVAADGTVEENRNSEASYLNETRRPLVAVPEGVGADAEPQWRTVGADGTVRFHDHRIHWMGTGDPVAEVTPWEVPLVVDGAEVLVSGRYVRLDAPAPWPWWLAAVAAAVALALGGLRREAVARVSVVVAAAAGLPVAWSLATAPKAGGGAWTGVVLLALAAGLALGAAAVRLPWRGAVVAGAGASLLAWAVPRLEVWSSAVLVSDVPAWWDRGATALALAAGAAAVAVGVRAAVRLPVPAAATG